MQYDGCLDNASQETVYNDTVGDVVDNILTGYNGTVFCYGQVTPPVASRALPGRLLM